MKSRDVSKIGNQYIIETLNESAFQIQWDLNLYIIGINQIIGTVYYTVDFPQIMYGQIVTAFEAKHK